MPCTFATHLPPPSDQVIRQAAQLSVSGLPITLDIDDAVERLPVGPIYSVVTNALCNSMEALQSAGISKSNDHPHIALSAGIEDGQLTLTIRDNGPGLDPALISDDGKFRFGQSTKVTGHGLGLSLSRKIVLSLGGCLDVQNHPQGGVATCLRYHYQASRPCAGEYNRQCPRILAS